MNPHLPRAARSQALRAYSAFGIALAGTIMAAAVLVPGASAAAQAALPDPFLYTFNSAGTLYEAASPGQSTSPYFWLASGGALTIANGHGQTLQGTLKKTSPIYAAYAQNPTAATDNGAHPQNAFLLFTKQAYANVSAEAYFDRTADNLSRLANAAPYNGEDVIVRYKDASNYYYGGIRADGTAVIKKKVNGAYQTLATAQVFPGAWSATRDADLIPLNAWEGVRLDVTDTSDGPKLSLYVDKGWSGTWKLAASVTDSHGTAIEGSGTVGFESDYGDVTFDNIRIAGIESAPADPTPPQTAASSDPAPASNSYDSTVLAGKPVLYLAMGSASSGHEQDLSGHGHAGTYKGGTPATATLPNGDTAADFNGTSQYLTIPSSASLSIPTTGALTWEGWVRADTLDFPKDSEDGYVDWMGKCENYSPSCEWEARFYGASTPEGRAERLSAYVFNPSAGLGSAADWQPSSSQIASGEWVYVVAEYQTKSTPAGCSSRYPGSINIWVDGVKQSFADHAPTGCMSQYQIQPKAGSSPLDIGTMALDTFFKGAIGKVAVYDRLLSQSEIDSHFKAMTGTAPGGSCGETCSLISSVTSLLKS